MLYSFILFIIMIKIQIRQVISLQDMWLVVHGTILRLLVYFVITVIILVVILVLKLKIIENYHELNYPRCSLGAGGGYYYDLKCGLFFNDDIENIYGETINSIVCSPTN